MVILRSLVFTLVVPGSVTVWIPLLLLQSGGQPTSYEIGALQFIGVLPIALGAALYLWSVWDFASAGKGTPAPWDAPRQVVIRGPYRLTRNPMYVAVELILLGEAVVLERRLLAAYAGVIGLLFYLFVRYYEEPTLRRRFGATYEEYCRAVPRWLPGTKRANR
jgi:protein-S-isoprenylcysteine O-methyltransferase Ste14